MTGSDALIVCEVLAAMTSSSQELCLKTYQEFMACALEIMQPVKVADGAGRHLFGANQAAVTAEAFQSELAKHLLAKIGDVACRMSLDLQ